MRAEYRDEETYQLPISCQSFPLAEPHKEQGTREPGDAVMQDGRHRVGEELDGRY